MADPTGFLKFPRQEPGKRPAEERSRDWKEFSLPLSRPKLSEQGARCMDCGVPFCQSGNGCPVENLIPDWNDLVGRGLWQEALEALHRTNNFPEFTGKLCPAPCESACVLGLTDEPVSIRAIESSIIERGFEQGWVRPQSTPVRTGKRVAIVGSGPCGLAAAQQLARAGHSVTVFEKGARPGGLLRYGIPDFKFEKRFLDRRICQLEAEGVVFRAGIHVGRDVAAEELRGSFDAVCLAIGAERARDLAVPGRELQGIHPAMEYLVAQNRRAGFDSSGGSLNAFRKRVIILGGGDTGSDCLGTAIRQGCLEAHQFEILPQPPAGRDSSTPWPLWPMKLRSSHAHEEGGSRRWSVSTTAFLGTGGKVSGLRGVEVRPGGGRFEPVPGSEFEMRADLVLLALGFSGPAGGGLVDALGIDLDSRGNIRCDSAFMTSVPGVFAAGDARRGASLIVWAIAEGRKMAASVDRYLAGPLAVQTRSMC